MKPELTTKSWICSNFVDLVPSAINEYNCHRAAVVLSSITAFTVTSSTHCWETAVQKILAQTNSSDAWKNQNCLKTTNKLVYLTLSAQLPNTLSEKIKLVS